MANDKRERQRENREQAVVAQARERADARRKQQRALVYGAVAVVALIVGAVFIFGGDDEPDASASGTTESTLSTDNVGSLPAPTAPSAPGFVPIAESTVCPAGDTAARNGSFGQAPELTIDTTQTINATMQTNAGTMEIELYPQQAPLTANNFVFLVEEGYFDCLIFHRVIQDFVIQGGDPTGTGTGGPGYQIQDELPDGYELGALAMANSGPNTNGSQFFIITGPNGQGLPNQYSKFGQVVEGLDVALNIQRTPTAAGDRPTTDIFIESVTIG